MITVVKRGFFLAAVALLVGSASQVGSARAAEEPGRYAVESAAVSLSSIQAGAHADMTIDVQLSEEGGQPFGITRDLEFSLPPGAIGNPQAIEQCTVAQLGASIYDSHCPFSSQVGITEVKVGEILNQTFSEPLYNMEPPANGDVVARFGFFAGNWPSFINVTVNPIDYSVTATLKGNPSAAGLISAKSTLWAVPADPVHDLQRVTPEEAFIAKAPPGGRSAGAPKKAFLTNPTTCEPQRALTVTATSYQLPEAPSTASAPFPQMAGCAKLDFQPSFTAVATNPEAFAPTGISTELVIPQDESPGGRGTSALRSAEVTLPQGFAINAAAGDGQQSCSSAQVGFGEVRDSDCPDGAKIGSVDLDVPALARPLRGSVYLRTPEPGHLFRFWVVTDEQGVHLKLPAEIGLDPASGQISTVFAGLASIGGLPQVPFSALRLDIFGGPRAPLSTPGCGTYQTSYRFTPWSGGPAVEGQTPTSITSGCGKGGFSPRLVAGTLDNSAGQFSPFVMTLTREDGEANPQTLSVKLPQGLLAKLGGVPVCPEADTPNGSCPPQSRVGRVLASAGVGGAPLWIPQAGKAPTAVFLAGPYKGAPYSLVSVVPAQAGPFDLGTVVNRAAIRIDPNTARATVVTDPLPQILEGVPVLYRTINVQVDRPNFTLNPTSCSRKQIEVEVTASSGASASPSDSFQATDCAKLGFKPKLSLQLKGATKRAGHPALKAVLTMPKGGANIGRAQVGLPQSEFLDQGNLSRVCTQPQLRSQSCPARSIYGRVKAWTPLLDRPLEGNIYLGVGFGYQLPALVAELDGQIRVLLKGKVDTNKAHGLRNSFEVVPDAPVSRFVLELKGGKKYGLLENSENICGKPQHAKAVFMGQNGRVAAFNPRVRNSCKSQSK